MIFVLVALVVIAAIIILLLIRSPQEEDRPTTFPTAELENAIDILQEKLGIPQKFILPGGTIASSFLHLCRATTRRAERSLVTASKTIPINSTVLRYVNRLSDFLYILARDANKELDVKEQQPIYKYFNSSPEE